MSRPSLQNFPGSRGTLPQSIVSRQREIVPDCKSFSPCGQALARFFDGVLTGNFHTPQGNIQSALSDEGVADLRSAVGRFPVLQRRLVDVLGEDTLEILYRYGNSPSLASLHGMMFRMAKKAAAQGKKSLACSLYQFLIASQAKEAKRSEQLLKALSGKNSCLDRIEARAPHFIAELTNPATILGMTTGLLVSSQVQRMVLPQLWGRGFKGFAARSLSALSAFGPEVGTVWAGSKLVSQHISGNNVSWDAQTNFYELRSLTLSLAGLKLMGFVSGQAYISASQRVSQGQAGFLSRGVSWSGPKLWHQLGMGSGIFLGHGAEILLGWRSEEHLGNLFFDTALQWLSFNLTGDLSQSLFPKVYLHHRKNQSRLQQEESIQRRQFETQFALSSLSSWHEASGAFVVAAAEGAVIAPKKSFRLPMRLEMSQLGDSSPREVGGVSDVPVRRPHRPTSGRSRQALPDRTGGRIDPFEQVFAEGDFPSLMLSKISSQALDLIQGPSGAAGGRSTRHLSEDFGRLLGEGIFRGIQEYFPRGLEEVFQEAPGVGGRPEVQALDEVVGVVEYAYRTGQKAITHSFENSFNAKSQTGLMAYDVLKLGLRHLLDVPIKNADGSYNVLSGDEAMVSVGNGDMLSLLNLMRHRIRPGDLSWRYRLFAIARSPEAAREINEQGTYEKKLGKDRRVNFLHDPAIIAIGPQGHENLQQSDVMQALQYQILNINSANLHEVLARPGYLENLPYGSHLLHVIKGWIGSDRGIYSPKSGEQPTLLPYELIQLALLRAGRTDVSVTSGGGFIPGKYLWWGRPVEMAFASHEDSPGARLSSAARDWAWQLTGHENFSTPYLTASHHHHQHSTDLGGAMKNVVSTWAGLMATHWALENYQRRHELSESEMTMVLRGQIIPELESRMIDMLRRDNVVGAGKPLKFHPQVRDDFERCCSVQLENLLELASLALKAEIPIYDHAALELWVLQNVVQKRSQFADTRNPIMGILTALVEKWNGAPYHAGIDTLTFLVSVAKKGGLTTEGLDSLGPLLRRNQYAAHPIEYRDIDPLFLRYYNLFYPNHQVEPSLTLPGAARNALRRGSELYPGIEVPLLRRSLQTAWERRSQASVDILGEELARLAEIQSQRDSDSQYRLKLHNQQILLHHLMGAMEEGVVFPIKVFSEQDPLFNSFVIPVARNGVREPDYFRIFLKIDGKEMLQFLGNLSDTLQQFEISKSGDGIKEVSGKKIDLHIETAHLPVDRETLARQWQHAMLRLPDGLSEIHRSALAVRPTERSEWAFRELPEQVREALNAIRALNLTSRQDISEGLQSVLLASPEWFNEGHLSVVLNGTTLSLPSSF